jgi:hypothetical protein
VLHNLIATQDSRVPFLKFQMASRLKILMASGSKKGTQIYFSFLSKVPTKEPPPGSPTGPLWREILVYRAFCISLKDLIKIPLIRRPQERSAHPRSPKQGPYGSRCPFLSLAKHIFGFSSKGAHHHCSLHGIPLREIPRS